MSTRRPGSMHCLIAAEAERSLQRLQSLGFAMEANETLWRNRLVGMKEIHQDLVRWAYETGAATRYLDYVLRKSQDLRDHVLELMENLTASLQNALDHAQMVNVPLLSPAIFESVQTSYFDRIPGNEDKVKSSPATIEDMDVIIEDIKITMSRLKRLAPVLANPFPFDMYPSTQDGAQCQDDISLASRMFPATPIALRARLGQISYQRRLLLRRVKERILGEKLSTMAPILTPGSSNLFPLGSPGPVHQFAFPDIGTTSYRAQMGTAMSRKTSQSGSTTGTFWSKAESVTAETVTSVDESVVMAKPVTLSVPPPPIPLEKNSTFQCSFCGQDVVVGETLDDHKGRLTEHSEWSRSGRKTTDKSSDDPIIRYCEALEVSTTANWARHVFSDLEPYCCTYTPCQQGHKALSSIDEWLEHELYYHRLTQHWVCQMCSLAFDDVVGFEQHMAFQHSLSPESIAPLMPLCKKFADKPPILDCNMCGLACSNVASLRTHVTSHMEQLALACVEEDHMAGFGEVRLPSRSTSTADTARLEEFVFATTKLFPQDVLRAQSRRLPSSHPSQNPTATGLAPAPALDRQASTSGRPVMPQRGRSYEFMANARKERDQKLAPPDADLAALKLKPQTVRTNTPPKNVDFVGRINDMANIHEILHDQGSMCVLSGAGGLGKSTLAAEYTHHFESEYAYIFWIQAETPMICAETFSQIALATYPEDQTATDEHRLVGLSREFLEATAQRWLVVFDNVDQKLDLQRYLPLELDRTCGSVLITTNPADSGLNLTAFKYSQIELNPLNLEESRRLLLNPSLEPGVTNVKFHPEYALAGEIAKRAENLPLALSLIAGYTIASGSTLSEFVEMWNERQKHLESSAKASGEQSQSQDQAIDTVWDIGLRELFPDAQSLLNILAFLDPDYIPKDLLVGEHEDPTLDFLHASEASRHRRITNELRRRRLIATETKNNELAISIHRKLKAKLLRDLNKDPPLRERAFRQAFTLVRSKFPGPSPIQVPEPSKWPVCKKYLPHVLSIQKLTMSPLIEIQPSPELAHLFSDGGINLWERGLTTEGLELMRAAEAMLTQLHSTDDWLRADIHVIISLLLQDSGLEHVAECKDRIETSLNIRIKQSPIRVEQSGYSRNDEILLYNAYSDYACVLLQFSDFEQAAPIFQQCHQRYQTWGPPSEIPYEYAKYHHHIAFCQMYDGDISTAYDNAVRATELVQQATGTNSAATCRFSFDQACILQELINQQPSSTRSLQDLLDHHLQILTARLNLHGKFAFLTLESTYAVGAAYARIGNLSEAESYMRLILEREKARPGSFNEAALARTQFHLSQILTSIQDGSQASQNPTTSTVTEAALAARNISISTASIGGASSGPADDKTDGLVSASASNADTHQRHHSRPSQSQSTLTVPAAQPIVSGVATQSRASPARRSPIVTTPAAPAGTALAQTDPRHTEASDLSRLARQVLEKNRRQGMFAHLMPGLECEEARQMIEENGEMVLFDLMQPVFDGRFVGRDVLRFLRIVLGKNRKGE